MFGVTLRTVGSALLMIPFAGILGEILGILVPVLDAPDSMLAEVFTAISNWSLTIGLLSCLVVLMAAAVTESEVPR